MPFQSDSIRLQGVRHNNLKGFDLNFPLGKITVVTGLSGSGKSSLVFDTLYAEGQRRYVETFSPYARQFLERLDPPRVDAIENIPPAIAIQQGHTVKTSRSSVGTLTELCDYFKLLMPNRALLICPDCGQAVQEDTPLKIFDEISSHEKSPLAVAFPVTTPTRMRFQDVASVLMKQGYRRWWDGKGISDLDVHPKLPPSPEILILQDRFQSPNLQEERFLEALEAAFRAGKGHLSVINLQNGKERKYSKARHCATCNRSFPTPTLALFSFNNPLGACPKCRGFGRIIEIDPLLVIPNPHLSLREGAIKPWQSGVSAECQDEALAFCRRRGIDPDTPFQKLPSQHRVWILEGDPNDPGKTHYGPWYGVKGYFEWLESKSYKMHMRVLLSRYRTYRTCPSCDGSRFQSETLNYHLDGKTLGDLYRLPIRCLLEFMARLSERFPQNSSHPDRLILDGILSRLQLLRDVGLDYLTLDRPARTLSGGEIQRVNLTSCLGSAMVHTLFILDEPSVGLHPRDVRNLIRVLHSLRDRGNTLVIVEHDPSVIRAADHLIDLGPGAGENGGHVVLDTPLSSARSIPISRSGRQSLTLEYLMGRKCVARPVSPRPVNKTIPAITIRGASENNLKNLSVKIPLGRFVCVTGVSGSGKSTLIHRVLYENLQVLRGKISGKPGRCKKIFGHEKLSEIVMVDQSPLSRTSRSTPVVYIGAWDFLRDLLAATSESRSRGFTSKHFSFNTGEGRCLRCGGVGFEKVEMQFLPDVLIQCAECHGRRFRSEILNVRLGEKNVADLLELTITGAIAYLREPSILVNLEMKHQCREDGLQETLFRLQLLKRVGLGYLRLGQPINTLSGGEAQRLKLCGFLTDNFKNSKPRKHDALKPSLLIFDEPTTGLHFDDVGKLVGVLQQLTDQGHTVLVIEHNLELIQCADWILDLGPEAGDRGGALVAIGSPETIASHPHSYTGHHLRKFFSNRPPFINKNDLETKNKTTERKHASSIQIFGAREHNLKNVSVAIPHNQFVVLTGLSGSGKSTLAFDLIFAEGQRRFLDCMSTYARQYVEQMSRPNVDRIEGVPPTVAIEQRVTRGGWKSTVATITEAYHFIRLLYAKTGIQHCPKCKRAIHPQTEAAAIDRILSELKRHPMRLLSPSVRGRKGFHSEVILWASRNNVEQLRVDGELIKTKKLLREQKLKRYVEHTIEFDHGIFDGNRKHTDFIRNALRLGRGMVILSNPDTGNEFVVSTSRSCDICGRSFSPLDPKDFSFNSPAGWCPTCFGYGVIWQNRILESLHGEEEIERDQRIERRGINDTEHHSCPDCHGARLKLDSLQVHVGDRTLTDLHQMSARAACDWLEKVKFNGRDALLAKNITPHIIERLRFMKEVGLDYLGLGRSALTLSGGEAQRIRLASQLGSNLRGVLYVLDEPTIGLHARDNERLLSVLERLKARGNSLLVVEHDEETMRRADWMIDLGPGAGKHGGEIVWSGKPKRGLRGSRTLDFLNNPMKHPFRGQRRHLSEVDWITIKNASLHNLRRFTVRFPLARLSAVTGVSGAGKSSLVRGILLRGFKNSRSIYAKQLSGHEKISNAYEVDQSPIGKTPRSCPATYLGVWDEIRRLFSGTPEAKIRGYTASRFSFNTENGRCEVCEGQGRIKLAMNFLPDAYVPCDACDGSRFDSETLHILYRDKNIAQVLQMSVEEAADFFSFDSKIAHPLKLLADTGLGYVSLGQSSPSLSGGESQRMKLVGELMRGYDSNISRLGNSSKNNLYILEEPTIGLHFSDVKKLIGVLHRLVDHGHTVIVIEHNLDLIAEADYVVDLGPDGGENGGQLLACGSPEDVTLCETSHTARFLKPVLSRTA